MSDTAARPHGITCTALYRIDKGNLLANCTLQIPAWHLEITGCKWCRGKDGNDFIALPQERYTKRDGTNAYKNLVSFTDRAAGDRFQAAALAAVREFRP